MAEAGSFAIYRFMVKRTAIEFFMSLEFGEQRMRQLSDKTGLNYTYITQIVNEMVKEGLVEKNRADNVYDISLTEKGQALCDAFKDIKQIAEQWGDKHG